MCASQMAWRWLWLSGDELPHVASQVWARQAQRWRVQPDQFHINVSRSTSNVAICYNSGRAGAAMLAVGQVSAHPRSTARPRGGPFSSHIHTFTASRPSERFRSRSSAAWCRQTRTMDVYRLCRNFQCLWTLCAFNQACIACRPLIISSSSSSFTFISDHSP